MGVVDEFEGYHVGDLTYCMEVGSDRFFPVRVVAVSKRFLEVMSLDEEQGLRVTLEFDCATANRRFLQPRLPRSARFGGCDERLVNSERESGAELRLLPTHYATHTGTAILALHRSDPERWPLPTGLVYERWFRHRLEDYASTPHENPDDADASA